MRSRDLVRGADKQLAGGCLSQYAFLVVSLLSILLDNTVLGSKLQANY